MEYAEAVMVAREAHADQVDKAGEPYIGHLVRVGARLSGSPTEVQIAGVLHDTLEDTALTEGDLVERGVPLRSVEIIKIVSRRRDETYAEFIERIALSGDIDAMDVKLADLADNTDPTRTGSTPLLRERYDKAKKRLGRARGERVDV